ncbi:hypothetical protein DSO57_1035454 [Entomophthora muscae]|uniref:Uncharacterized protein n=1 Tax=Entomophthora muscae TaxID=34485 RepID=A0ACC2RQJ9_9FUNG|nr:hypothetical protein DSO57_1035454 [Entomophthora muscae]
MSRDTRTPETLRSRLSFYDKNNIFIDDSNQNDFIEPDYPFTTPSNANRNSFRGRRSRLSRLPEMDDTMALNSEFQSQDQNQLSIDLLKEVEFLELELKNTSSLNSVFAALNSNLDQIHNNIKVLNSNLASTNNILSNWTSFIKKSIFNTILLATPSWKNDSVSYSFILFAGYLF